MHLTISVPTVEFWPTFNDKAKWLIHNHNDNQELAYILIL